MEYVENGVDCIDCNGSEQTGGQTAHTTNSDKGAKRYGIQQSLLKRSLKYIPAKVEQPKLPEHQCSLCSRGRKVTAATNYCTVCDDKLCSECTFQHNKFKILSQHKIVPVKEAASDQPSDINGRVRFRLEEKCSIHGTKVVDRYCRNHDTVGCSACMALEHRTCLEPEFITKASAGLLTSNIPKVTKQAIQNKRKDVQAMKDKRISDKKRCIAEKDGILVTVTEMRKRINAIFDRMEQETIEKLNEKYGEDIKSIKTDIRKCDEAIASLDAAFQRLNVTNEAQLFVNIKRDAKAGIAESDSAVQTVIKNLGSESIVFNIDDNIEEWLGKLSALGKFDHEKAVYVGSFYAKVEGTMESDANKSNYIINGLLNLPDGRTVIADWTNKRLKLLDKTYFNICSHCDLSGAPFAICGVSSNEIVVSIRDEKTVQFITIEEKKMVPSRKFKIDEYCRGITYRDGELYITCGGGEGEIAGQLRVYNLSGLLQRVYDEDIQGQKLFKSPKDVLINNEGTKIHVVDRQKGVITLSMEGRYQSTFKDPGIKTPYGITTDSLGNLFVIGYDSNNVLQVGSDGKKLSEVLKQIDGIVRPMAICCHESVSTRLLISTENNSEVKVFTLQEK